MLEVTQHTPIVDYGGICYEHLRPPIERRPIAVDDAGAATRALDTF